MANKRVAFHEAAADEYVAALDWYFERSEEAASRFATEFELAIELISEAPQRWPSFTPADDRTTGKTGFRVFLEPIRQARNISRIGLTN